MRNLILNLTYIICFSLLTVSSYAQDGLALLKVDPGARQNGMGSARLTATDDPNTTAINPATSIGHDKFNLSLGHNTYWENVRIETGYFASPLTGKTYIHGGITFATVDNIESRQSPTVEPDALFEFRDIAVKLGLSRRLNDKFSTGFSIGYVYEKIDNFDGGSFSFDLGLLYELDSNISLAAAANNLGSNFNLTETGSTNESRDISQPTNFRFGGSYSYEKYNFEINGVILDDKFRVHTGAEWQARKQFEIRAGYMANYDSKNITAGATFIKRNFKFNYAFVPFTNNLGTGHMFNITIGL